MIGTPQSRLLHAIYACLRPIVRVLIRAGISYAQFAELAKLAFVQEASRERDVKGRSINTSRVAVRTGISRKEVRRVREAHMQMPRPLPGEIFGFAATPAQVLHRWYSDAQYLDASGTPRPLPLIEPSPSFADLVKGVSGDLPLGAIRAELKQAGAIDEGHDGTVRAVKRFYVPRDFDDKAVTIISGMLFPMAAGLAHNADPNRGSDGFIQRIAFSRALDAVERVSFRRWARLQSTDFIESMDRWLGDHERRVPKDDGNEQGPLVGIGVFYYEGPSADEEAADRVDPRR